MINCKVIENFTLEKFNELNNVKKVEKRKDNEFGVGDTFECTEKMADYLTGNNALNKTVVEIIEIKPEKKKVEKELIYCGDETTPPQYEEVEEKSKKKKTSKK